MSSITIQLQPTLMQQQQLEIDTINLTNIGRRLLDLQVGRAQSNAPLLNTINMRDVLMNWRSTDPNIRTLDQISLNYVVRLVNYICSHQNIQDPDAPCYKISFPIVLSVNTIGLSTNSVMFYRYGYIAANVSGDIFNVRRVRVSKLSQQWVLRLDLRDLFTNTIDTVSENDLQSDSIPELVLPASPLFPFDSSYHIDHIVIGDE